MPLCYRCEHRARFLETMNDKYQPRPRYECGDIQSDKAGCYMYKPVTPPILTPDIDDPRPQFGPPMISSRSYYAGLPEVFLKAKKVKGGTVLYHEVEDEL